MARVGERVRGSLSWIKVDPEMNEKFMEGGLMKGCQTCEKVTDLEPLARAGSRQGV